MHLHAAGDGRSAATSAWAHGKTLTNDPLTGLALSPATIGKFGNAPNQMPDGTICTSKMQGNFYTIDNSPTNKTTMGPTVAWHASHLKSFTHVHGYSSRRWTGSARTGGRTAWNQLPDAPQ